MTAKTRLMNIRITEDKEAYTYSRLNEYAGKAVTFRMIQDEKEYDWFIGNYKGQLMFIAKECQETEWNTVGCSEEMWGDDEIKQILHKGNGKLVIVQDERRITANLLQMLDLKVEVPEARPFSLPAKGGSGEAATFTPAALDMSDWLYANFPEVMEKD